MERAVWSLFLLRLRRKSIRLPVEVLPEAVDAVDDAVELVQTVGVRGPQLRQRAELGQVAEAVLGRLGHRHLTGDEAAVALAGMDPEGLRRLLREEGGRLIGGDAAEEEARGEADRARGRCDEVRQVAQLAQVALPPLAGEQGGQRRAGHELLAQARDEAADSPVVAIDGSTAGVAGEQDAALLQQLAHRGHPERERGTPVVPWKRCLRDVDAHAVAARQGLGGAVGGVDPPARERVVTAQELHGLVAADHPHLEGLGGAGGPLARRLDRRGRLGLDGRGREVWHQPYRLISWATRSRCHVASPNVNSDDLARLKYRCRSCSQVKPMPPCSWMPVPAARR